MPMTVERSDECLFFSAEENLGAHLFSLINRILLRVLLIEIEIKDKYWICSSEIDQAEVRHCHAFLVYEREK